MIANVSWRVIPAVNKSFYSIKHFLKMFSSQTPTDSSDVIFKEAGCRGMILLNRPKALNALNQSMVKKIYPILKEWESTKKVVIMKGMGEKAFCAGGDVKSIVLALNEPGGDRIGKEFFKAEYTLDHLIGTYRKPYIAIMHGITMGGGVGLSVLGKYRIATESTLFAMPETAIGLFPDVGGSYFLPRLKGKLGMFLGLTGYRLKGADVLLAGIATHFVPSDKLDYVTNVLLSEDVDIDTVLKNYGPESIEQDFSLKPHMQLINECFSASTVEEIIDRLSKNNSKFAKEIMTLLNKMSPTALKVTKRAIDQGSYESLAQVLKTDYRLACSSLKKGSDFYEGVRAVLIDKDQKPIWKPNNLTDVTDSMVEERFQILKPESELVFSKL